MEKWGLEMYMKDRYTIGFKGCFHLFNWEGDLFSNNCIRQRYISSIENYRNINPNGFSFYEYNFQNLGITYKIEVPNETDFDLEYGIFEPYQGISKVEYVRVILMAFERGLLDNRIKDIYFSRPLEYGAWSKCDDFINELEVWDVLSHYSNSNSLYYRISLEELLRCDPENISPKILKEFNNYNILLKRKNKLPEVLKIFNRKITINRRKKYLLTKTK